MKLIIDIDEEIYESSKRECEETDSFIIDTFTLAIGNGTPIPDNATFGDTFEKVFRPFKVVKKGMCVDVYRTKSRFENNITWLTFSIREWNALYQKGGK